MSLDQIGIALSGAIAVWLTQDQRESWRRWACIFGVLGQPFWFYAAWSAEQWGIFALCLLYSYAWARGLWTHWLGPALQSRDGREGATIVGWNSAKPETWPDIRRGDKGAATLRDSSRRTPQLKARSIAAIPSGPHTFGRAD
jgi:hypothetical protein